MDFVRLVLMGKVEALQDIEHFDQLDAAGRWRRHRDNVIAPISAAHRHTLDRAVALQIVDGHDATRGLYGGGNFFRDRTEIERVWSVLGDELESICQIALHQAVTKAERRTRRVSERFWPTTANA